LSGKRAQVIRDSLQRQSCHVEPFGFAQDRLRETSLISFRHARKNNQRFFAPLRMTMMINASTIQRGEAGLLSNILLLDFFMPERIQKPAEPAPWGPKEGDGGGPRSPDVSRPDTKDLLKKMRKVDPNQSKRYRQRTGQ
jgi:hypothetical protein